MIDQSFIEEVEGNTLSAYVPDPENSQSGVTIGVGVDLGSKDREYFSSLPSETVDKLEPYFGLTGMGAVDALEQKDLVLSDEEISSINQIAKKEETDRIIKTFNREADIDWDDLTGPQQTVVASVSYQYGSLPERTPKFWGAVIREDWETVIEELRNFGDRYPSRRNKEADLLEKK